ncbi:chemotaxis protein CheW [Rhodobacter ferrooxidans]|uniref:CheW protein n=1 Tax=Rhodobacter ferrooxidans TaxID=371731 RepID=C8S4H2_9RHOB|nr:chemotaxis protein CheW [Rhodobacter sp. SW2]EEW24139.1 CheW protein [Rhodobacter sp. SW2]
MTDVLERGGASGENPGAPTAGAQVLTLGVGDELFAVPVTRVQEILDLQPISRLPNAPGHLLGVINVRGEGVAVVDLRAVLHLPPQPDTEATRIVVLWVRNGSDTLVAALKADRVQEVTELDPGPLTALPQARLLRWEQQMVDGLGKINGAFVTVLDIDRMFDSHMLGLPDAADPARDVA